MIQQRELARLNGRSLSAAMLAPDVLLRVRRRMDSGTRGV